MTGLSDITAATVNGRSVSLAEVLRVLKADGELQFLQDALRSIVITEAAENAGLSVSDDELQEAVDAFRQKRSLQSAEATNEWLKQNAITVEDLESRLTRALLAGKLKSLVTEGKDEQYFAENRADFDAATISQIVVADEGLASELKSQIEDEDADFAALARQHSVDGASARAGGYVGRVGRKALSPAVQAAVFGASAGDVVGPVKTDQGYHVIRVEATDGALDSAKKTAIANLLFKDYVAEAMRKAEVQVSLLQQI